MTLFKIPHHIGACISDGFPIFLDVEGDNYLSLPKEATPLLIDLINKREIDINDLACDDSINRQQFAIIQMLLRNGLATGEPIGNNEMWIHKVDLPKNDILIADPTSLKTTNYDLIGTLAKSYFRSLLDNSFYNMYLVLQRLYKYRPRHKKSVDHDLINIICNFRRIRPLFYTASDRCYFDCLVLMYFLKSLGLKPTWVFAVSMPKFQAHCWVQIDDTVVTDSLTTTNLYTPILAL